MKIAEIDWPLFWHALNQQDSVSRGPWLGRWVFPDDGVRLSLQPEDLRISSDDPVKDSQTSRDRVASVNLRTSEMTNRRNDVRGENKQATRGWTKLDAASKQRIFCVIG